VPKDRDVFGSPILLLLFLSAALLWLSAGLRPDSFYTGDSGVKLIAARNALEHPSGPLAIPLPRIGAEPLPFIEPFFAVHGDHAHAITSELFLLLTAPLFGAFGWRGLYLLPGLGFLLAAAGVAWLAVALEPRRNPSLAIVVVTLGTPLLFYGLEFWEHAPAVAAATLATALLVTSSRLDERDQLTHAPWRTLLSGCLFGTAVLLRPEAVCFLIAVLIAARWLPCPPGWKASGLVMVGLAFVLGPFEAYWIDHFGSIVPPHVGTNAGLLRGAWATERLRIAAGWVLSPDGLFGLTRTSNLWATGPAALLALVPLRAKSSYPSRRFLRAAACLTIAFVLLTAPNDGGAQWGPRYLLFAYLPLSILAVDTLQALPWRRAAVRIALAAALAGGIWIQRSAYRELRGSKLTYGSLVDFVASKVAPGGYLVTDLWWLDQVAAAATKDRQVLYAPDLASGRGAMQRLDRTVVPTVTVIRSRTESADVGAWAENTCYVEINREALPIRALVAIVLHHRCKS
jgi:hypothetical protein